MASFKNRRATALEHICLEGADRVRTARAPDADVSHYHPFKVQSLNRGCISMSIPLFLHLLNPQYISSQQKNNLRTRIQTWDDTSQCCGVSMISCSLSYRNLIPVVQHLVSLYQDRKRQLNLSIDALDQEFGSSSISSLWNYTASSRGVWRALPKDLKKARKPPFLRETCCFGRPIWHTSSQTYVEGLRD